MGTRLRGFVAARIDDWKAYNTNPIPFTPPPVETTLAASDP